MITIAIPVYNGAIFLNEAVESVICQLVKVDEILIIDDASTDNTQDVVEELQLEFKYPTIKYYNMKSKNCPLN